MALSIWIITFKNATKEKVQACSFIRFYGRPSEEIFLFYHLLIVDQEPTDQDVLAPKYVEKKKKKKKREVKSSDTRTKSSYALAVSE